MRTAIITRTTIKVRLLAAATLSLLLPTAVIASRPTHHAAGRVPVAMVHLNRWYAHHHAHVAISYPRISGLHNSLAETRINGLLRSAYPPGGLGHLLSQDAHDLEPHTILQLDGTAVVTLNRKHAFSVYYEGLEYPTLHGQMRSAHPNKLFTSMTLNTRTGGVYRLGDLFHGTNWQKILDNLIVGEAHRQYPDVDAPTIRDAVRRHDYSFYLTPGRLVIFNIFEPFALASVDASIPKRDLSAVLNPNVPF